MKIHRFLPAFLCITLLLSLFCISGQATGGDTPPFDGQGTAEEPYCIENTRQLWALAGLVNAGAGEYAQGHYRLTANLDLGPADWVPIGMDEAHPFRGVFDGDGHAVALLRAIDQRQWPEYGGFFGMTEGAVIDDLYVEGNIGGQAYAGQLVGWAKDSQIKNCVAKRNARNNGQPLSSGLVGRSDNSRIENCCYIQGGALVGEQDEATRIVNSFSAGLTNLYYHGDGSSTQVWGPSQTVSPGQAAFATGFSDFVRELNAWVDGQPEGRYRHWRVPEDQSLEVTDPHDVRALYPTVWPVLADYLVEVRAETAATDAESLAWFQGRQEDNLRGYLALDGVYVAQANRPPCITGLDRVDGFRLAEVYLDGQAVGPQLPAITGDCTLTLSFVPSGDIAHFTLSHPDVEYPDVAADAWYGAAGENTVSDVTRLGFFVGRDDGCFDPEAPLTLAEAVKLAAVVHSTYTGDGYPFDQTAGERWFDTYQEYAVQTGILYDWEFDDLSRPATRAQMAHLFHQSIPQMELVVTPSGRQISPLDIGEVTYRYQRSVYDLYWYGVLRGADQEGNFYPDRTVTRAEAAAILVRLTQPEQRFV